MPRHGTGGAGELRGMGVKNRGTCVVSVSKPAHPLNNVSDSMSVKNKANYNVWRAGDRGNCIEGGREGGV